VFGIAGGRLISDCSWVCEKPLTIQTLKQKRAEITGANAASQARIAQARHDLTTSMRSGGSRALNGVGATWSAMGSRGARSPTFAPGAWTPMVL
jgi:hypothetical protein